MTTVDLARTHVDTIRRRKPALACLFAQELHLLVDEVARVAHARPLAGARARARHARAAEWLVSLADHRERNDALGRRLGHADDRFEVDLRDVFRELLLCEEIEESRIAVRRC